MNIYLIINEYNLKHNINPYLYVGSDTKDRILIEDYSSSSKPLNAHINEIGIQHFSKTLLWRGTAEQLHDMGFSKLTELEREIQLWFEAADNPMFYNVVYASEQLSTEGRSVYYRADDPLKTTMMLSTNDLRVLSGEYVGRNKGVISSSTTLEKLRQRPHPSQFIDWSAYTKGHKKKSSENYKKPKSESHKQNMRKPKIKSACPQCGLMCAPNVMSRHIKSAHSAD